MNLNLKEATSILSELTAVFQDAKDEKCLATILDLEMELRRKAEARQQGFKELIRALTSEVDKAEDGANDDELSVSQLHRMDRLKQEKNFVEQNLKALDKQMKSLRLASQEISKAEVQIKAKEVAVDQETRVEIPRVRHLLSLYDQITKLRWDYDSKHIKGFVSLPNDLRPFDIDPAKHSRQAIADHLWDLMDEDNKL
ncbi:hypothetical protein QOT17_013110 [Balamuthia mandrillaris]